MKFYNNNLDYTIGKYNNPYGLIMKAGKNKTRNNKIKSKRNKIKSKRNKIKSKRH